MSHLSHEVCGVDFFLSYNKCSQSVIDLIENVKLYLNSHRLAYFSNDYIDFNQDYMHAFQLQAIRSKVFLFFIDKYALECEWFINFYMYAHEHSLTHHLPILIPVIFDDELEADCTDDDTTKFDKALKLKLINDLTKDCGISINMSEIPSFKVFVESLREAVVDIIPIKDDVNVCKSGAEFRFIDNNRPLNSKEEEFFKLMKRREADLVKKFSMSRICMRYILPKLKTYVALSVPFDELNPHLTTMLNVQCHLIWIDCTLINKVNYFNLIWQSNDESYQINSLESVGKPPSAGTCSSFQAKTPSYMIFFDLNTAQLARITHEFTVESNWTIQLVDSYVRTPNLTAHTSVKTRLKTGKLRAQTAKSSQASTVTTKSFDEIFYMCQFKKKTSATESNVKLQQGIIDTRYNEVFKETVRYRTDTPLYIPLRSTPLLVNVNTITNKHFYFTSLYMPYQRYKPIDASDYNEKLSDLTETSLYYTRKNLSDLELMELFNSFSKNNWKLVDLKAYRDEKSLTKFAIIWTTLCFYEGTSRLFIGLNKNETLDKIEEMTLKGLYPRIVTAYCYSSKHGEHLYAAFFCQF